jgi:hypothetical protein
MLSASLTHVDRLHVRGFKQLDARDAHVHSRPAYLPSAAKLAEWSAILEKETSMNHKPQIGIQIKEHFKTSGNGSSSALTVMFTTTQGVHCKINSIDCVIS